MNKNVLPLIGMLAFFASCSPAYKTTQTPDDVYYSPGKAKVYAEVKKDDSNDDAYQNKSRRQSSDNYQDYTSNSNDNYLRMKTQNRYQWNTLDDNDYWYSPNYAYNNYYGFNSFNPYSLNSWGLSYYYSPFASIQSSGWFNNYYPSYGYGYGYSPYSSGFYGHNYGYGYYGYSPVNVVVANSRTRTSRPMLGAYTNSSYNNANSNSNRSGRYIQPDNGNGYNRYNNSNNSVRYNNNNNSSSGRYSNNTNTNNNNTYTPPARSYTPSSSSSGGSSSGGSSVSRPVRH